MDSRRIFRVVVYRVCRWARSFVTSVAASVLTAIPRHCLRADLFIFTVEHGVGSRHYLDLLQSELEFLVASAYPSRIVPPPLATSFLT